MVVLGDEITTCLLALSSLCSPTLTRRCTHQEMPVRPLAPHRHHLSSDIHFTMDGWILAIPPSMPDQLEGDAFSCTFALMTSDTFPASPICVAQDTKSFDVHLGNVSF